MPSKRDDLYSLRAANAPVGKSGPGSVTDRLRNYLVATYGGSGSVNDLLTRNSQDKKTLQ